MMLSITHEKAFYVALFINSQVDEVHQQIKYNLSNTGFRIKRLQCLGLGLKVHQEPTGSL